MTDLYPTVVLVTPRLRAYVGAKAPVDGDRDPVRDACSEAAALVDRYIAGHGIVRYSELYPVATG